MRKKTLRPPTDIPGPGRAGPPVRVRMYRQGLGDCFLLTFDPGGQEAHVLIDCGSLGAVTTGVSLAKVVADIRKTTGDHLHLLIATHEHQDHVSGFRTLKTEFQKIKVDRVWLAWTEDPADPLARQISKYQNDLALTAACAVRALGARAKDDPAAAALGLAITDLLGFVGDATELGASGLAKTIDEAMTFVRTGLGVEARYLSPGGEAIEESWAPGFRFYVLGPPRSTAALRELGSHESAELYHLASGLDAAAGTQPGDQSGNDEASEGEMPFDRRFRLKQQDPLMAAVLENYLPDHLKWRRLDNDWLHGAADLALQLDSMTNNTSLALAIERIGDGRVLLFAADAQQGNWLSWHQDKWSVETGFGRQDKTAAQLLNETVFYKVGHHASHNATAKANGLELMRREQELVAFIPVDRAVALTRNPKGTWQMPARTLYRRLLEKCQGRVARSDLGWAEDAAQAREKMIEQDFAELADTPTWSQWRKSQQSAPVKVTDLYIEFLLS